MSAREPPRGRADVFLQNRLLRLREGFEIAPGKPQRQHWRGLQAWRMVCARDLAGATAPPRVVAQHQAKKKVN